MAKQKFEAELGLNNKSFLEGLSQAEGGVGKFGKAVGALSLGIGAAAGAFKILLDWIKDTDFGMAAMNTTMKVSRQLLTDLITGNGLHLKEAVKNAQAQNKINEDNAKEGYLLAKMNRELHELEVKAADQTLMLSQKKEILTKAMEKEHEIKQFLLKDAKEELRAAKDYYKLNPSNTAARENFYKAAARVEEVQSMDSRRLMSQYTGVLEQMAQRGRDLVDAFTPIPEVIKKVNKELNNMPINPVSLGNPDITPNQFPGLRPDVFRADHQALFGGADVAGQWKAAWEDAIMGVADLMSNTFTDLFEHIGSGSMEGFGQDLLKNFGSLVSQLGKMLVALGTTMLSAQMLLGTPSIPNAIAAIAAGGVAMAIGGAMMGAASRGANSLSGGGSGGSGNYSGNSSGTQTIKVEVQGRISGKDIALVSSRYGEDN